MLHIEDLALPVKMQTTVDANLMVMSTAPSEAETITSTNQANKQSMTESMMLNAATTVSVPVADASSTRLNGGAGCVAMENHGKRSRKKPTLCLKKVRKRHELIFLRSFPSLVSYLKYKS